ncbi:MAG TPA: histidine kinase [Bryobacteraceae bacterium]|nr:histidine kinase [Bryobacteraceae bacterium]
MHPILARSGRLGLYLLAWIPIAGLLVLLLAGAGGWGWLESTVFAAPLCLIYAFVCLSAWYPVRMAPPEQLPFTRLIATHLTAAILVSSFWTLVGTGWAHVLAMFESFRGFDQHFRAQMPLLFGMGAILYLVSVALYYALAAMERSHEAEGRAAEARILARDAELKALKAQVNPHFLFNSLHSISALTTADASKAREMCILLSDFLRRTLGLGEKAAIPLEEELALVRNFLAVEKVRFGPRLAVDEAVPEDCRTLLVPPLLLQPLVENAITHGIGEMIEGGSISIEARRSAGDLVITIANTFDPDSAPARRNGLGLSNVRQRIEAYYGSRARLETGARGNRYVAELSLPAGMQADGA